MSDATVKRRAPPHFPEVAIVVLNWNGWKDTLRCVESLQELNYPRYDIRVVDNGSTDGSPRIVRQRFPNVDMLELGENLGFPGGMNRGIEHALAAGAEFVLIMNNDAVMAPGALTRLVEAALDDPTAGMLACELRSADLPNRQLRTVTGFDWLRGCTHTRRVTPGETAPVRVDSVSGCALMIRREVVESIGLMDERYFIYFEDLDWAVRARRAGWGCLLVPGAIVWHRDSATTRGDPRSPRPMFYYYYMRNNILFVRKQGTALAKLAFVPACAGSTIWWMARVMGGGVIAGKRNVRVRLRAIAIGFLDGWLGRWGPKPGVHPTESSRSTGAGPS